MALPACTAGVCSSSCAAGFADCDRDLGRGALGNGCETSLADDPQNCGACGAPCAAAAGTVAACAARRCGWYALVTSPLTGSRLHGGPGGLPFSMLCQANEVVTGLRVVATDAWLYGLAVDCGHLELARTGAAYTVKITPGKTFDMVGASITGQPPPVPLKCPPSTVVIAVTGTTWSTAAFTENVKAITLTCAELVVDAARQVTVRAPTTMLSAGSTTGGVTPFADACGVAGALVGLTGRNGTLIDAVATTCGKVAVALQ